jgi:hypothetical protein
VWVSRVSHSSWRRVRAGVVALAFSGGIALVVLAQPAVAEECPNVAFRTGPSTHLPDCRAYELVSPAYKAAGEPLLASYDPESSSALLAITGAVAGLESFNNIYKFVPAGFYSTQRTAAGWTAVADDPPASEYLPYLFGGFQDLLGWSLDDQTTVWTARGVWQPENALDLFMRLPDRSIVDVGPLVPPTVPPGSPRAVAEEAKVALEGVSADASRLVFALGEHFWPGDGTEEAPKILGQGVRSLYEYAGTGNTAPLLVGVGDNGEQIGRCGVALGGGPRNDHATEYEHNAISRDGEVVFFTAFPDEYEKDGCKASAPPVAELFARVGNGLPGAHTVAISEPSEEDCSACYENKQLVSAGQLAGAQFLGASADGSKVFFETTQPLLGGDTSENIYEYDFDAPAGERVVRVSGGDSTVSNPAAEVIHIGDRFVTMSEDGSHVYFLANGVLTKTPNVDGEAAEAGAVNLYVFERDAGYPAGRTAFVARLSQQDEQSLEHFGGGMDVTPDGRFVVFASNRDLTPDDTTTALQVFEYDAQTGALVRVSIGQHGFNHNGNVPSNNATFQLGDVREASEVYPVRSSVSADGSYVFFQSDAALVPQALEGANNVYEYHEGWVSLISDGADGSVNLLGTDSSGADVFFETKDPLVAQDTDSNVDIYDARIDGGFPVPAQSSCSGEGCQGPLSGAPTLLSPGSEFQAGGNPPLASEPAVKTAKTKKPKKMRKPKKRVGRRRAKKASRAAVRGRADRKGGRS